MPNGSLISIVVVCYVLVLLAIAWAADHFSFLPGRNLVRGVGYGLSLSVLCTSWTYFGAVGLAMRSGWSFLPNSLGPMIALTLMWPVWRRVALITKRENISSVADFIASRYGKSRPLGALIACIAIVGALPYIALQMMALSKATAIILGRTVAPPLATILIVIILAGLSILFGARRPTLTQHNRGLTQVVAFESLIKIAALITVAGLAVVLLNRTSQPIRWSALGHWPVLDSSFIISTMLCTVTMFTLPRVFHLGFVTFEEHDDLRVGRWLFPSYMVVWALAIVPIAVAGITLGVLDPDTAVLSIPMQEGGAAITSIAFLGGFSAGAAMVMVETIALSAMIANELILPWLARSHWASGEGNDISAMIVNVRRAAIIAILGLGYVYFYTMAADVDPPRLGFASLAASAQLIPSLVGAVVWRRGHAKGAVWGLVCGMTIWLLTVAAPQLGIWHGPIVGVDGSDSMHRLFDMGVCLSLACNLAIYVGVSLISRETLIDRIQANSFLADSFEPLGRGNRQLNGTIGNLRTLLERFLGPVEAALGFSDFGRTRGQILQDDDAVTPAVARMAERMLAGAIGASSARNVIALALAGEGRDASDVGHILDEAAHAVQFSREIVHTAFNALDQGISVVDADLRLLAWNDRYLELYQYPPSEVYVGKPLAELMALSRPSSGMSLQDRADALEERIGPMRRRERQSFEREWPDGTTIRVVGRPLKTGEYVTSYTDVTEIRAASRATKRIAEDLERRVQERTKELMQAIQELGEARAQAERVTAAQNRFVAAASHDLLQPMHATRLYIGAARETLEEGDRLSQLLLNADLSVEAADRLLKALLNLSKIEIGGIAPEFAPVDLRSLLGGLMREFAPMAQTKGLGLHISESQAWALSNPDLLRSVLQNLVGNAIRYTSVGHIMVCVRREREGVRIEVRDSGPGIPLEARELIFGEFTRLSETSSESGGAGLGLAIVKRICGALQHRLTVRSAPGRGSVFAVSVPRAEPVLGTKIQRSTSKALDGLRILCVEDKPEVLQAQRCLLEGWGAVVTTAQSYRTGVDALAEGTFDVVIADWHLGAGPDGLDLLEIAGQSTLNRLLITADISESVRNRAFDLDIPVLRKPAIPGALRSFLTHAVQAPGGELVPSSLATQSAS